jgi:hypothetical protein
MLNQKSFRESKAAQMKSIARTMCHGCWLSSGKLLATLSLSLTIPGAVQAQVTNVIYQDNFARGGLLNGSAPSPVNTGNVTWSAFGQLITDGSEIAVTNASPAGAYNNAFLPFSPQSGHVYTLSVDIKGTSGGVWWQGFGFAQNALTSGYYGAANIGIAWGLQRGNAQQSQAFLGPGTQNLLANITEDGNTNIFNTYRIVLNAATGNSPGGWLVTFYRNGVQVAQGSYSANPTIQYVGLGADNETGFYRNFSLTDYEADSGPPVIAGDLPGRVEVRAGQPCSYSIYASGAQPLYFQWFTNGVAAASATNSTFVPATGIPGSYFVYVVLTNLYNGSNPGRTVSATSILTVDPVLPWATNAIKYWVGPAGAGTGDGSSPVNAAYYMNPSFWTGIQSPLQSSNVNVNFVDGAYNGGNLILQDLGNPLHWLVLQAVDLYGAVFSPTSNHILDLTGSQRIGLDGLVFNGPTPYWGIVCQPDYLKPCRDIALYNCRFQDLTNAYYGALGLINGVRDVTLANCSFTNISNGGHAHMVYASHNNVGIVATNCVFQDCLADYVRFRDNSEYCTVQNCKFISTSSASGYPFVSVELYNQTNGDAYGDEFFGNYFQISSNTFTYNSGGGPGPYSAFHFSDSGYSPWSYHCDLTPIEATQLSGGTTSFQQSFLQTNLGIISSGIKMFGNTYNSRVAYHLDYTYAWDGNAPYGGWQGTVKLDNVPDSSGAPIGPIPALRNGNFDRQGLQLTPVVSSTPNECLFQAWFCNPKYTVIKWHPGFNGTTNALMFDRTANQYVYQWITSPGPTWTMDCLFAIGSGFTGSGTKFKVDIFHNDIAGSKVSVGVDNLGRFGIYNGGTFTVLPELGTLAFSVDNNGNGYYNDPGDVLNVYRLRIVGNYSAGVPFVNLYTSDANSAALSHRSLGRAYWVNGAPMSGQSAPETIAFYNYTAPVIVDQVDVASALPDQPPVIANVRFSAGNLIFSGTNGFPGATYYVLSSTNLALPASSWTREITNVMDATGSFSVTNTAPVNASRMFYRLQLQ